MSEPVVERRANPNPLDVTAYLAMLYTVAYMGMVGLLFFMSIPSENKDLVNTLVGIMSAVQMSITGFFFGSSKNAEATQRAVAQRSARAETVIQEIAKAPVKAEGVKAEDLKIEADNAEINIKNKPKAKAKK